MYQMQIHKTSSKSIILFCLLLLVQTSLVWAAEDIIGDWQITMDFNGQLKEGALEGQMTTSRGSMKVMGKKI